MPIQSGDIKLLKSDTMADVDEGGGAMTANVVEDNVSNNIFDDISTLDRVYGAVHLRKVFPAVQIQTTDKYYGAHVIISKLPGDQKIGVNLFSNGDWFDRRPTAASRIEDYRAQGARYDGWLWATQWEGTKTINIFQFPSAVTPEIGGVLYLEDLTNNRTQYVKITDIEITESTRYDNAGVAYDVVLLEISISQPLEHDFIGVEIAKVPSAPTAIVYNSVVANASKYYSARPLALTAAPQDFSLFVEDVYSQLIPSSTQEQGIVDQSVSESGAGIFTSRLDTDPKIEYYNVQLGGGEPPIGGYRYLGTSVEPFSFFADDRTSSAYDMVDDGNGNLVTQSTGQYYGTIDYETGALYADPASTVGDRNWNSVFIYPATAPNRSLDTYEIKVTAANRGQIYGFTLPVLPAPLSVSVSYAVLGSWYTLVDAGGGELQSRIPGQSVGGGTVNYETGTVSVTLSALPDVDTSIIISFAKPATYINRGGLELSAGGVSFGLSNQGIISSQVTFSWDSFTASVLNDGTITGDATGFLNLATGQGTISPNELTSAGATITVDYNYGQSNATEQPVPSGNVSISAGGVATISLAQTNILPGTLEIIMTYPPFSTSPWYANTRYWGGVTASYSREVILRDDGAGNIIRYFSDGTSEVAPNSSIVYATGVVTYDSNITVLRRITNYSYTGFYRYVQGYTLVPTDYALTATEDEGVFDQAKYSYGAESPTQEIITVSALTFQIPVGPNEIIVPGSMFFRLGWDTVTTEDRYRLYHVDGGDKSNNYWYRDVDGAIFNDYSYFDGSSSLAGNINYDTGVLTITNWLNIDSKIHLYSLLTEVDEKEIFQSVFRIPSAPVRSGSFQITGALIDGSTVDGTSDGAGVISGSNVRGEIKYDTGIVSVQYGELVPALGNEGEWWYDVELVESGQIFKPAAVLYDTLKYNAVIQTFIPLSPDILGLDPVRLPQDGRVPVYSDGDVVVVLNEQTITGTYINTDVVDFGRGRIAKVVVRDAAGQLISADAYTTDLDVGTLTWVDVTGISQPVSITHRVEDMALVVDVQITGEITLSKGLTHDFPIEGSLVSNAVVYGDLYARTTIPFDQATWTGVWSDVLIGNQTSAQYNNTQYPIVVDNYSAIQERWYIYFTNSTTVNVVGENVGQIATGINITSETVAPVNPNTGQPYFTIPAAGWGSGWASGNILRFNTVAANAPLWIIQSVGQGEPTDPDYNFCIEVRGDIDTP